MEVPKQQYFCAYLGISKEIPTDWNMWPDEKHFNAFSYTWNCGVIVVGNRDFDIHGYHMRNYIVVPDGSKLLVDHDPQLLADWTVPNS
jgi:hypothetical protein